MEWRSPDLITVAYKEYIVALNITAEDYRRMYSGQARNVVALDREGRSIQFPATALRPFVSHDGISGTFRIRVDEHQKLLGVCRLDD